MIEWVSHPHCNFVVRKINEHTKPQLVSLMQKFHSLLYLLVVVELRETENEKWVNRFN